MVAERGGGRGKDDSKQNTLAPLLQGIHLYIPFFGKTAKTLIIEHQAFSQSYDMAPPHPLPLSPSSSFLSFSVFLCVNFRDCGGRRGGGEAKSDESKKTWSSINHSILSKLPRLSLFSEETALCPYIINTFFALINQLKFKE